MPEGMKPHRGATAERRKGQPKEGRPDRGGGTSGFPRLLQRDPTFLGLDEVLDIHADQLRHYGGMAGLRDLGLLESALAVPAATFDGRFLHETVHEMAAAYLVHLAQNHPFVDGNKRTALMTAISFLGLNDVTLVADPRSLTDLVLGVAERRVSKAEVAVYLKANTRPVR
jgi:death-on-curing protein